MSLFLFSLLFAPAVVLICTAGYYANRYAIESWRLPAKKQIILGASGIFSIFAKKNLPESTCYYLRRAFICAAMFLLYVGVLIFFIEQLGR